MHATIGGMWTMMAGWGMVVHGGGWWCVEDGGGVCGQSSQACFHAESIEMDNLTLTPTSSTYEACAHVPPTCIPRLPPPMALVPKNTKTNSTINTKHNQRTHRDRRFSTPRFSTPRFSESPPCKYKREVESADHRTRCPRVHNFNLMYAQPCSSVPT
jgi:hypothetical protein